MIQRLNQRQKADIRRGFRENPLYQYLNEVCKPYESELPGLRLSPEEGNTFLTNGYGELGEAQAGRADEARTLNIYNNAPSHFYNESKFENTRYITGSEPKWLQNLNI